MGRFRHLGDRQVHAGSVWDVAVGTFESPDGDRFDRDVVRSPGAVGVLPLHADGRVVLVRQYRPAFDDVLTEIPAGMRDVPGEAPEVTAHRELAEEVGLRAGSLEPLARFYPSAGMTDSIVLVYLATELSGVPRDVQGPEESHMEVIEVPLDEALAAVDRGEIVDAKSVIGLLLLDRRRRHAALPGDGAGDAVARATVGAAGDAMPGGIAGATTDLPGDAVARGPLGDVDGG